ncbi:branched-chain-amino-acid aminotransferase, cytosolic isoform X2 [Bacillus rossius redtenbacheri]|uniref:branched-chain-amino-acid aminotransferase, cytosolic isoform X2 n=1 Tax=Bacillus rossius redtenbacheri TaxID=93214 RepID=UPI002FDC94A0
MKTIPLLCFRQNLFFAVRHVFVYQKTPGRWFSVEVEKNIKFSELAVRLAGPHQLQPKPEASALQFGQHFTDHMLKIHYYEALGGWQRPEIMPMESIVLHPAAKVLHYAVELFEGMKAYRGLDNRIRIFRPQLNMARMNMTAERAGLPSFDGDELIKCLCRLVSIDQEWVPHSEASSLYIRPTLIGIDPALGVAMCDSAMLFVILCPVGSYFKSDAISLLADPSHTRAWPGGCGDRKMGSNYAPTIHIQELALKRGLQQVLWLYGENHLLTEVGTMNIFMVYTNDQGERELVTPPLDGLILPGITRQSVLDLAREWREFPVSERPIPMAEVIDLYHEGRLLELFGTGTACVISPIRSITYRDTVLAVPTLEQTDALNVRVKAALTDIQYGRVPHPWAIPIDEY